MNSTTAVCQDTSLTEAEWGLINFTFPLQAEPDVLGQAQDGGSPFGFHAHPLRHQTCLDQWRDNHERATAATNILIEIVKKQIDQISCVVLRYRSIFERFFAWMHRQR